MAEAHVELESDNQSGAKQKLPLLGSDVTGTAHDDNCRIAGSTLNCQRGRHCSGNGGWSGLSGFNLICFDAAWACVGRRTRPRHPEAVANLPSAMNPPKHLELHFPK